jgi:hypothetical protein
VGEINFPTNLNENFLVHGKIQIQSQRVSSQACAVINISELTGFVHTFCLKEFVFF